MNVHLTWSISALTADICEIITYLQEDEHYSKSDAAEQLKELIDRHISPLLDKAMNGD